MYMLQLKWKSVTQNQFHFMSNMNHLNLRGNFPLEKISRVYYDHECNSHAYDVTHLVQEISLSKESLTNRETQKKKKQWITNN